ncbi:MAG: sensor histidine kinase [Bacteroidia bacterium]
MWKGAKFWGWLAQVIIWCAVYLLISPLPLGLGGIALFPYAPETVSIIVLYSLLLHAFIFYSYTFYWFPRYLETASIRFYWLVNISYLLGIALLKSIIDWAFTLWVLAFAEGGVNILGLDLQGQLLPESSAPYTFWNWLLLNLMSTAMILLIVNAYNFIKDWWQNRRARQQLENEKLRMELSALKHQINPHFLFNILNGLYALALKNDDEQTADGIEKLSGMMRYVLYESNDTFVLLEKEIAYIQNYIELQRLRVGKHVKILLQVEGPVKELQVAPMLFIPFIENAFKFGISTAKPSDIFINLKLEGDELQFEVENTIHQRKVHDHIGYQGIGLENVEKRLQLLYPNRHLIDIHNQDDRFRVLLTLKL